MRRRLAAILLAALVVGMNMGGLMLPGTPAGASTAAPPVPRLPGPQKDRVAKGREQPEAREDSVLVRLSPAPPSAAAAASAAVLADHKLDRRRSVGRNGFAEVTTRGRPAAEVYEELKADPRVAAVEPNYVVTTMADPSDTYFADQYSLKAARFPEAWARQPDAADVTVAVVDTGVDLDHPDLYEQLVPGWDAVSNDSDPQDENRHGTMVAGIIGASSDNGRGIAGGTFRTRIQPVRALDAYGRGSYADVAEGITWAADNGADVINLSLGGASSSTVLADAVAYAQSKGILVVAAAGNSSGPEPIYPGALPGVLTVAATDANGQITWFSSQGPWVDVAAGGVDVISTNLGAGPADSYAAASGTSFAAPMVAAAAALLRQAHPDWDGAQISARITSSARDAGPAGHDNGFGFGLLDIEAALGAPRQEPLAAEPGDALEPNPLPEQATLLTGTATATIAPEGDVDWFAFDIASTQVVTASVTVNSAASSQIMDPTLSVEGPGGEALASVNSYGPGYPEVIVFEATTPGRYRLRVGSFNAGISGGSYTVTYTTAPAPTFAPHMTYGLGSVAVSSAVADLNGDGRGDAAVTTGLYQNYNPAKDYSVFVYPQLADGTLGSPTQYRTTTSGTMVAATGDLDRDGDADLAISTSAGAELFKQSGGKLVGPTVVPFAGSPTQLVVADLDGDGRKDLLAQTANGVELRRQLPTGWSPPTTLTPDKAPELEVGDISGDGRADLVLTLSDCRDPVCIPGVSTYAQQPGGTFAKSFHPLINRNSAGSEGAAIGDVNGDGRSDLTVTVRDDGSAAISTFYQQPDGTLGPALRGPLYGDAEPIEAGDVNGDGRADLVTAYRGWNTLATVPQLPDGTLGPAILSDTPYPNGGYDKKGLSLGDLDGRPGMDVALASPDHGLIVYRQARVSPTYVDLRWVYGMNPLEGSTNVSRTAPMTVTFGRMMAPSSLSAANTALLDGSTLAPVPANRSYDPATRRLTITPTQTLLPGAAYQLVISGVTDAAGTVMTKREVSRFRASTAPVPPSPPRSGYWMLGSAGAVYGFGAAAALGNASVPPGHVATSMAVTPSGNGYWVVTNLGALSTFGDAPNLGGSPPLRAGEAVTSISSNPAGQGYWLFTSLGRAFAYGTAQHLGGLGAYRLGGPITGSVATPSGRGYYMVAADGGIFAFGDAKFQGSMGGQRLNAPVMGLAPDPDGVGYWLVGADGGIFAFASTFRGSMGGVRLAKPVMGMVAYGDGYMMVASDGGIFNFSSKPFHGSLGGRPPPNPVMAVAPLG